MYVMFIVVHVISTNCVHFSLCELYMKYKLLLYYIIKKLSLFTEEEICSLFMVDSIRPPSENLTLSSLKYVPIAPL